MSIDKFRRVWYHVVDVDGKLYEGVDSDDSMTSSSAIKVKDIRKAVIDEYSHLKNIDPADFKIYQNKKAWEEKRQPLLKISLISGGSKEDHLFVVVPPPVWFQLVGADGLPFKGCKIFSLLFPRCSSINEFCDAVKAENPNVLSFIDPSQLTVFENKAVLETNNPLRGSTIIGEFGKLENDPLMVLVPDQIPSTSKP